MQTVSWGDSLHKVSNPIFLFFQENRIWHFMQIGDNLHKVSNPIFLFFLESRIWHFMQIVS